MTPAERLVYASALVTGIWANARDPFKAAALAVEALRDRAHRLHLEPDSMLSEFLAGKEKR